MNWCCSVTFRIHPPNPKRETSRCLRWPSPTVPNPRLTLDGTLLPHPPGPRRGRFAPQAALQVLGELQGTEAYASTFGAMMRGLVQTGGQGQRAAELITQSNLNPTDRAELISELARCWVRQDADATIAWANNLTAPEDFRVAIRSSFLNSTTTE